MKSMDVEVFGKSVVCPVLVGRTISVGWLCKLFEQACSGKGQVVVIAGEAGIGKSRLIAELKARLAEDQSGAGTVRSVWVEGRCFESDRTLPYGAVTDLLRAWVALSSPEERVHALEPAAQEVVKLIPEMESLFPRLPPSASLRTELEQRRLREALIHVFSRLASQHPLVLVIEDVHWSDDTSLEFLLHLARRVGTHRILLLITYRTEEVREGLANLLASLDRERLATELRLIPLSSTEVDAMVRAIFGLKRAIPTDFLTAIYALTQGNPFFVEEVLKTLLNTGGISYANGEWLFKVPLDSQSPRTVQYAVQRRVEQLQPPAKRLAGIAAVVGQHFDFSLLQVFSQEEESRLLELIKELITAQLVVEESDERFMFRHALTRQAIYESMLARERKALHRKVGEHLEQSYGPTNQSYVVDLAYHYYAGEVWRKALDYCQRAGERALALFAPGAAAEHFTRALEATERLAMPASPQLYRGRGQAYATLGDPDRAFSDLEKALRSAKEIGDHQTEWEVLNDLGMLWAARDYAKTSEYYREAFELAQQFGKPAIVAHSLNRIGNWHVNIEQPSAAREYHLQALATFRTLNDEPGIAETLDFLGMANLLKGNLVDAIASYEEALSLLTRLRDQERLASSLALVTLRNGAYQVDTLVVAGPNRDEAIRAAKRGLRITREIGWRAGESFQLSMLGSCLGYAGRYGEALDAAQRGLAIAEDIGHSQWRAAAHCILGAIYLDLMAFAIAKGHLGNALALARQIGSLYWLRTVAGLFAQACVGLRQLDEAELEVKEALGAETRPQTLGERQAVCSLADVAMARGNPGLALEIVERLVASDQNASTGQRVPRLRRLRGAALAGLGLLAESEGELHGAIEIATELGTGGELWRAHSALAKIYRTQRRWSDADKESSAARSAVEGLAESVVDQTLRRSFSQSAMAQIPVSRSLSAARQAKEAFGGLTAREREVAGLITQGKSNRAIARELVVAERTVTTHVANILAKLGFTSRVEIAAWAVERGLGQASKL